MFPFSLHEHLHMHKHACNIIILKCMCIFWIIVSLFGSLIDHTIKASFLLGTAPYECGINHVIFHRHLQIYFYYLSYTKCPAAYQCVIFNLHPKWWKKEMCTLPISSKNQLHKAEFVGERKNINRSRTKKVFFFSF